MFKTYKLILLLSILGIMHGVSAKILRDPTRPPEHKNTVITKAATNNMKISGIFTSKDHKSVIIGKNILVIGDKVADLTITKIDKDGITLKNKDGGIVKVARPYYTIKSLTTKNRKKKSEKS